MLNDLVIQKKIKEIHDKFPILVQEVIEKYYLLPLNGDAKINLKDGYITRPIHGAMHIVRVSLWVELFHKLQKEHLNSSINATLTYFKNKFKLSEEHLLSLIKFAGIFHDSARENEGVDLWDETSSDNFLNFLLERSNLSLADLLEQTKYFDNVKLILVIVKAIALKDKITVFNLVLQEMGLATEEDIKHLNYIRQLIHDADCLDILRCIKKFDINYLEISKLAEVDQDVLIDLIRQVHALLYQQGDLLYSNGTYLVKDRVSQNFPQSRARFLLTTNKVKLEHAENVYINMLKMLISNDYFNKFFKQTFESIQLKFSDLEYRCLLTESTLIFNPFIHGTNSSILTLLPKTEFKLQNVVDLMGKYQLVPISGEISSGGFRSPVDKCYPCFGRSGNLSGIKKQSSSLIYDKKHIITSYARRENNFDLKEALEDIKKIFDVEYNHYPIKTFSRGFIPTLVNICRVIEIGYKDDLLKIISREKIDVLYKSIKQMYYFCLISFDYFATNSYICSHWLENITVCVKHKINNVDIKLNYTEKDLQWHFQKILEELDQFDLQKLWEASPLKEPEKFHKLINLLQFPTLNIDLHQNLSKSTFNLFKLKSEDNEDPCIANYRLHKLYHGFLTLSSYGSPFNCWLYCFVTIFMVNESKILTCDRKKVVLEEYRQSLELYINGLHQHFALLIKLLDSPVNTRLTIQEQQQLIAPSFPIILCHMSEEKMHLMDFSTEEYRAQEDIILGEDIKIIATDTKEHQQEVASFLLQHGFKDRVQVILFDELQLGMLLQPQRVQIPLDGSKVTQFPLLANHKPIFISNNMEDPNIQPSLPQNNIRYTVGGRITNYL